jgi:beta-lactamase superfamily II metal-dependent hydrolase
MATDLMVCKVYDVGQGQCTFFEIYDDEELTKPAHTILIDCGTRKEHATAKEAVRQIAETLKLMTPPTIDTLILTHSDIDHVNCVSTLLLDYFLPPDGIGEEPNLGINKLYYGGDWVHYTKKGVNVLTQAQKYLNGKKKAAIAAGPDQMGWNETENDWEQFRDVGDVALYLLAANTETMHVDIFTGQHFTDPKTKTRYLKNMRSMVVILRFADVEIVVTGDATALTLARCNQVLTKSGPLTATFMATLPHHGSEETALDLLNLKTDVKNANTLAIDNLKNFATNIAAQTVTASADQFIGYSHPSARLISYFWEKLDDKVQHYKDPFAPSGCHFYTAFFTPNAYNARDRDNLPNTMKWPPGIKGKWLTVQTTANIFTTLYFVIGQQNTEKNTWSAIVPPDVPAVEYTDLIKADPKKKPPAPSLGVTWQFTIDVSGKKSVEPIVSRPVATAGLPIGILGLNAPSLPTAAPTPAPTGAVVGARHLSRSWRNSTPALASIGRRGLPGIAGPGLRRLAQLP